MVDKFRAVVKKINKEKGAMNLFAILKMDEFTDKWTIILSAPWIKDDTFSYVRDVLIRNFTPEEMNNIARLGIFAKNEHIVGELLKYKEGAIISEEEKINGNLVHEAYILVSNSEI
ncbi:hypothetical protein A3A93_06615 [Candidatus Roizmanbacteria bacterium RIFCSPLOWO2_01_FULL_38_12]|uniref:Uncharacterized protein n=1 Tax=Candidatus Roizmanbacteria bacterium RIFCSPLOWO2_01_FULL_38_12 TaxID=1802061 RepID=A0A1F7IXK5_9BACT|nr:MAG: hypothetical protein A2861_02620 [Candidatus Roizmanbacteria bacterium RIFCSPHIGHO2_01_FULL_38_15]OGK34284.1 MAG: hypothetical protein A3F59_05660 [Candidatus Roizmanbacteria bacterium RIFCSPHIGHO2_12_FULL_38_13]OGK48116.1 MAG: hypothetical protein A3A93_06615 [Candidatus Roizmanbacteria bacterium RIFCSPLOWO2_01_FULL_38_12]